MSATRPVQHRREDPARFRTARHLIGAYLYAVGFGAIAIPILTAWLNVSMESATAAALVFIIMLYLSQKIAFTWFIRTMANAPAHPKRHFAKLMHVACFTLTLSLVLALLSITAWLTAAAYVGLRFSWAVGPGVYFATVLSVASGLVFASGIGIALLSHHDAPGKFREQCDLVSCMLEGFHSHLAH